MKLWQTLILNWHKQHQVSILNVAESLIFENTDIQRSLSMAGREAVMLHLIRTGHAEWEDDTQQRCRVFWKHPSAWAAELYDLAQARGMLNNVYTVYELHSGEDMVGTAFEGMEEWIIRRALRILEDNGKVVVYEGSTPDEDGVKFLSSE